MTDPKAHFLERFEDCSIIAILRGLEPKDAEWVGATLYENGIRIIEVPLNSPNPLESIETLRQTLPADVIVGAGTVTRPEQVIEVKNAGGEIIVSPNTDLDVIRATTANGLISGPGCLTPSEAFAALNSGAHALKIFPASVIGPSGIKALAATLPENTTVVAVGGVGPANMSEYTAVGVAGFGLGSSLFFPGISEHDLKTRTVESVTAANAAMEV